MSIQATPEMKQLSQKVSKKRIKSATVFPDQDRKYAKSNKNTTK